MKVGPVVAAALRLLEVPREAIIGEYLLSEGTHRAAIEAALDGLAAAPPPAIDLEGLRRNGAGPRSAR